MAEQRSHHSQCSDSRSLRSSLLAAAAALAGCTTTQVLAPHQIPLLEAVTPIVESERFDVGIVVFDPGVPKGEIPKPSLEKLIDDGIYPQIRRVESVQMATQLRATLQKSGHWGSVWVLPKPSTAVDVIVTARILESDGYAVRVAVEVSDATGRGWIENTYELETAAAAYNRQRFPTVDPYQDVFNSIANDMAAARVKLPSSAPAEIRTVGTLRYAAGLSSVFADYLVSTRAGEYVPVRLPAIDDPMLARTERIRQRERLLFDTLDGYYDAFAHDVQDSYDTWRADAREESLSVRDLQRATRWRTVLGIAALAASFTTGSGSTFAQDGLALVGLEVFEMRSQGLRAKALHSEMLAELSSTFDGAIEPTVLELEGVEHRLVGTAEAQYAEWVELLRAMFAAETGLPNDDVPPASR